MNAQTTTYFKQLTAEKQNHLATFNSVSAEIFATLTELAKEEYNRQEIATKPKFEDITAWASSSNICGFYFLNRAMLHHPKTNYTLFAIAFKELYNIDFENHTRTLTGYKPVAIYQDSNGNYYTTHTSTLDLRPLEKWQKELQTTIDENTDIINALNKIKRVYKKDGKPFANIHKNFENCVILENYDIYSHHFYGYDIKIYYINNKGHYKDYRIYGSSSHSAKTIDEILPTVNAVIDDLKTDIDKTQHILQNSADIYADVMQDIHAKILKYATPTNQTDIQLPYFKYTVEQWLKDCYLNI